MQPLVEKNTAGRILSGSEAQLLDRAGAGDDLVVYIHSQGYNETIMFANYAIHAGRVSGLSLPHLNHGDLAEPERLAREPISTVEYIYDSMSNNLLGKDMLDGAGTQLTRYTHNAAYRRYAWYSTRAYTEATISDLDDLIGIGDQFKLRLQFEDIALVIRPDIIFFPDDSRDYLVKSSAMLLPADFSADPLSYAGTGRPFIENSAFSLAYINVDSDNLATIVHKLRYAAAGQPDPYGTVGELTREQEGPTLVTRVQCEQAILVPER